MTPEGKVKRLIKAALKEHGVYYVMPLGTAFGKSGVPDFILCLHGQFVTVETKAGKNGTTVLQEQNMNQIMESGGSVMVIDETGVEAFKKFLDAFCPSTPYPQRHMYIKGSTKITTDPFPCRLKAIKMQEGSYEAVE